MREYTLYLWIGVWLILISLSSFGVPTTWKNTLVICTAIFILAHALLGYRRAHRADREESETEGVSEEGTMHRV